MAGKTYEEQLHCFNSYSLEKRRRRRDLIQVFKIIKGIDSISNLWDFNIDDRTRAHDLKLVKIRTRLLIRQMFYTQKVTNDWNGLNGKVSNIDTIKGFKKFIDGESHLMNMV